MIILEGPGKTLSTTDRPHHRRFCSVPAATVHYSNEPDWRRIDYSSITTLVTHSLVDHHIVLSPVYIRIFICMWVCVSEWVRAFLYTSYIYTNIFLPLLLLSSSWLLFSPFLRASRFVYTILYSLFPVATATVATVFRWACNQSLSRETL